MSRAGGYTAMQILEAVATKAGSFNPEKICNAYASVSEHTIKGLSACDHRHNGALPDTGAALGRRYLATGPASKANPDHIGPSMGL